MERSVRKDRRGGDREGTVGTLADGFVVVSALGAVFKAVEKVRHFHHVFLSNQIQKTAGLLRTCNMKRPLAAFHDAGGTESR
jgi:hypothetical protein